MRHIISVIMLLILCTAVQAEVRTSDIEYKHNSATLEGYLAYDDSIQGKRPGILVVHEWWGLTPNIKKRVEELASMGYVAFAADIYGKGVVTNNPQKAQELAGPFLKDRKLMRSRAMAGLDILMNHPLVENSKLAAIGFCFGGTTVLELARGHAPLIGIVSFHGGLDTPNPAETKNVNAKILVLHGADDPFASRELVAAFLDEMRNSGADWQMVFFGGAVHAFTNPEADKYGIKGIAYNEKADKRSWKMMKMFFDELFR
jgi:dienelactone hydrolase